MIKTITFTGNAMLPLFCLFVRNVRYDDELNSIFNDYKQKRLLCTYTETPLKRKPLRQNKKSSLLDFI